jgi:hypothetical protein
VTLPNFLLIGAARSGTTALYEYLDQHPDIFVCEPKEPHFFALEGERLDFRGPGDDLMVNERSVTDWTAYRELFAKAGRAKARGEASVSSLYDPRAPARIVERLPDARILCILRNPADRAFSAFMYMRSRMYEPLDDFRAALAAEDRRVRDRWHHIWHYRRMSLYAESIARCFELFGRDRVLVHLHDDFRAEPLRVVRECFEFLGVDPSFVPPARPSALASGVPKNAAWQRLLMAARPLRNRFLHLVPRRLGQSLKRRLTESNLTRVSLDPELREELLEGFDDDIRALEGLLGRDLSHWRGLKTRAPATDQGTAAAATWGGTAT